MPTPKEIEQLFLDNGVDVPGLKSALQAKIEEGSMTTQQAQDYLLSQYNRLSSKNKPTKTEDLEPVKKSTGADKVEAPGVIQGAAREFATGATAGLAPYIAGGTYYLMNKAMGNEGTWEELYEEGKRDYEKSQGKFVEERPIVAGLSNLAGNVAGIVATGGTVGAGGKALATATKAPRAVGALTKAAGAPRSVSAFARWATPRMAQDATTFGTWEMLRGLANEGQGLDPMGGLKAGLGGSVMGAGIALATGPLAIAEGRALSEKAMSELSAAQKVFRQIEVRGTTAALEGAAIATVDTGIRENRLPTLKETGRSIVAMGGLRTLTGGIEAGTYGVKRYLTPTQDMAARKRALDLIDNIDKVSNEIELATGERNLAKQKLSAAKTVEERKALTQELKDKNATLKYLESERNTFESELRQNPEAIKVEETSADVSPEEISAKKAEFQKVGKEISDDYARDRVASNKRDAAFLKKEIENKKTFREKAIDMATSLREATDLYKIVKKEHTEAELRNGKNTGASGDPAFKLAVRDRMGESNKRNEEIAKLMDDLRKKSPDADSEVDDYLRITNERANRQRDIQELRSVIKDPNAQKAETDEAILKLKEIQAQKNNASDLELQRIEENNPEAAEVAKKILEMNQRTLREDVYGGGRIDEETYKRWASRKGYSPEVLRKDPLAIEEEMRMSGGPAEGSLKRREGIGAKENRVGSSLLRAKQWKYWNQTNEAKKMVLKDLRTNGKAWPAYRMNSKLKPGENPASLINENDQIVVWNKGKAQVWNVPEKIAKLFNKSESVSKYEKSPNPLVRTVMKALGTTQSVLRTTVTTISQAFAIKNLERDLGSVLGLSRSGKHVTPELVVRGARLSGYVPERALTDAERELKKTIETYLGEGTTYREALAGIKEKELETAQKLIDSATTSLPNGSEGQTLAEIGISFLGRLGRKWGHPLGRALSAFSNASERTSRATVFLAELRKNAGTEARFRRWIEGKEKIPQKYLDESASEAYKVTLDFTTKMSPFFEYVNRYAVPFYKPAVIGANRIIDVLTNPETAPHAWRFVTDLSLFQALINTSGDKDAEELTPEINREMATKNFLYYKNGTAYNVALAQEAAGLVGFLTPIAEYMLKGMKGEERKNLIRDVKYGLKETADNTIPGASIFSSGNMVPTQLGKNIFELTNNFDMFSKTQIETPRMQRLPEEMREASYTSDIAKDLYATGKIKIGSPAKLDHFLKGFFGSAYKEASDAYGFLREAIFAGSDKNTGLPKRIEQTRFMKIFYVPRGVAYSQNVMDLNDELKDLEQAYNAVKDGGDKEKYGKKASLFNAVKKGPDAARMKYVKQSIAIQKDLANGIKKDYQKYKEGQMTKDEFKKKKEQRRLKAEKDVKEVQEKINIIVNKELEFIKKAKIKKGIK